MRFLLREVDELKYILAAGDNIGFPPPAGTVKKTSSGAPSILQTPGLTFTNVNSSNLAISADARGPTE